jgi:hypothetical protein
VEGEKSGKAVEVAVNHGFQAPGGRLFLGGDFGPAAVIEWSGNGSAISREAVLMTEGNEGRYGGASKETRGVHAHFRANVDGAGNRPAGVEARVMRGDVLLYAGTLQVGEALKLADGINLALLGVPFWARLNASRDPSLWIAYAGFFLVLIGSVIMFAVIKVDTCVQVTQTDNGEHVFVALKAQRFSPLYRDQFERLVRDEGGTI